MKLLDRYKIVRKAQLPDPFPSVLEGHWPRWMALRDCTLEGKDDMPGKKSWSALCKTMEAVRTDLESRHLFMT